MSDILSVKWCVNCGRVASRPVKTCIECGTTIFSLVPPRSSSELQQDRMIVAALAMQGLIARASPAWHPEDIAQIAVKHADALLAELAKTNAT